MAVLDQKVPVYGDESPEASGWVEGQAAGHTEDFGYCAILEVETGMTKIFPGFWDVWRQTESLEYNTDELQGRVRSYRNNIRA